MMKTLRYFMLLAMTAMVSTTFAQKVTFDFDADANTLFGIEGSSSGSGDSYDASGEFNEDKTATVEGVSVTVSASETDAKTRNRIWKTSPRLRLYNGTVTVSAPGHKITEMVFTVNWNSGKKVLNFNATADAGTITLGDMDNQTATWAGESETVVFTIASNSQIKKLEVTLDGEVAPAVLTIEGEEEFTDKTTVTITGTLPDGQVFYTLDGSEPTLEEGLLYSAPFQLTETTTVKAAEFDADDEKVGETVEKTFTKKEIEYVVANNIAEFNALANNTENVKLILKDAVVLGKTSNYVIVNDGTAGTELYNFSIEAEQGYKLNGSVTGQRAEYNGVIEMAGTTAGSDFTITEGTITPQEVAVAALADAEVFGGFYKLTNVEIISEDNKFYFVDGDTKFQVYDQFRPGFTLAAGTFNVKGIVGIYKTNKQFWPTAIDTDQPVETAEVANIAEFLDLAEGTEAKLNLADAKVLYSWTSNNGNNSTYVRDASGAICFNRTQLGLTTDEDLNGFVYVTRSSYNNLPQANVATVNETNTENLTHAAGEPAVAKEIALTEAADNLNDLVLLKNVAVTVDGTNYYATVGEDKVQIYNGFHLDAFNDLASFVSEEQNYDVKGIMVVYKTTYEIYPIAITAAETGNPYDLNGDGKVSTADIQVIINEMKK
ncbi:MAG: chitobiase/beta-hexosaminidase C-terminal domain-containing protein [Prevotella sp.]|nr:chitobiase/beta-hexosaminidase C-terminal domain-containing protein [Prevotella sp.]